MATAPAKVTFELKDGVNRVEIAIQASDKNLVMEAPYTTGDPAEIAALDENPGVKRGSKAPAQPAEKEGDK